MQKEGLERSSAENNTEACGDTWGEISPALLSFLFLVLPSLPSPPTLLPSSLFRPLRSSLPSSLPLTGFGFCEVSVRGYRAQWVISLVSVDFNYFC